MVGNDGSPITDPDKTKISNLLINGSDYTNLISVDTGGDVVWFTLSTQFNSRVFNTIDITFVANTNTVATKAYLIGAVQACSIRGINNELITYNTGNNQNCDEICSGLPGGSFKCRNSVLQQLWTIPDLNCAIDMLAQSGNALAEKVQANRTFNELTSSDALYFASPFIDQAISLGSINYKTIPAGFDTCTEVSNVDTARICPCSV